MATAVPEGVNFSGCLQGIQSCCLTWAQLSPLLSVSAGAHICYKRRQTTKSGIITSNVNLAIPVAWQTSSTCWVLGSPCIGWAFPKDLLALAIQLNFLVMPTCPSRKGLVSLWPSSPLLKQRRFEICIQVCACCLYSAAFPRRCVGARCSVCGASAGHRAQAIDDDNSAGTSSVELKQVTQRCITPVIRHLCVSQRPNICFPSFAGSQWSCLFMQQLTHWDLNLGQA